MENTPFQNTQLRDQLDAFVKSGKIKLRYPRGYKKWKERFDLSLKRHRGDVDKALDDMHGKPQNPKK